MEEAQDSLPKIPVWEMLTRLNQRSALGRVVINPPGRMAPVAAHPTGEEWFFCKQCGFACLTREKMVAHKEKHSEEGPSSESESEEDDNSEDDSQTYVIGDGDESDDEEALEFKDDIINKMKDHFQCGICRKVLVSLKGLRNHHIVHQDIRPEKCKICGATFKMKVYRDKHLQRSHNPSFENSCKFCPCRFETELGLRRHMIFYHNVSASDCRIFAAKSDEVTETKTEPKLQKKPPIMRASTALRKQNSPIKMKLSFPSKFAVQSRTDRSVVLKTIHQNSKLSLECHVCGKKFSSRGGFRGHLRAHNKKYSCSKCGANFGTRGVLQKHLMRTHGDGTFRCFYCPCRLQSEWVRRMHVAKYHPNETSATQKRIASTLAEG